MYQQSEKNLLNNSNISSTCSHNMVDFGPLAEFGASQQISTGFASWLHYNTDVAQRSSIKLCTTFGHLLGAMLCIHFRELLSRNGILPGAKFTLCPSLVFSYISSITARHSKGGLSQTLRRGTRNGITELSQMASPIFGWAAITLGVGSHSS